MLNNILTDRRLELKVNYDIPTIVCIFKNKMKEFEKRFFMKQLCFPNQPHIETF